MEEFNMPYGQISLWEKDRSFHHKAPNKLDRKSKLNFSVNFNFALLTLKRFDGEPKLREVYF